MLKLVVGVTDNIPLYSKFRLVNIYNGFKQQYRFIESADPKTQDTTFEYEVDDAERLKEEDIERKRDKSRLRPHDYRLLHGVRPYDEPQEWYHETVRYKRRLYGRYGEKSGVNPAILWPTRQELEERLEYERVAHPETLQELIETAKLKREEKERELNERQELIHQRMLKLDQWKQELEDKINKKQAEAEAAKQKKNRLIEEVRRFFGYTVDTKDERFIQMVEQKEKEEKKAQKEAKKKAKEAKMLAHLIKMSAEVGKVAEDKSSESKPSESGRPDDQVSNDKQ